MATFEDVLDNMIETGTAPADEYWCRELGVGYEDAFARLKKIYLEKGFSKGRSSEKLVLGPYGSGKTHFLRQLIEEAKLLDCATAEVALTRSVEFTNQLLVYKEVVKKLRVPGQLNWSLDALMEACLKKQKTEAEKYPDPARYMEAWIGSIPGNNFELSQFGKLIKRIFEAIQTGNVTVVDDACRWLEGDIDDRSLSRRLDLCPVPKPAQDLFAQEAMFSLFQLIKISGFNGTVVAFDESEQSFSTPSRQKIATINSLLQSGVNAITRLTNGSAFILYALTPDVSERMMEFPALQQRFADPQPGQGFWTGETRAPIINLDHRENPEQDLKAIGERLTDMLFKCEDKDKPPCSREEVLASVYQIASKVAERDPSISNRRTFCKWTAHVFIHLIEDKVLEVKDIPAKKLVAEDE